MSEIHSMELAQNPAGTQRKLESPQFRNGKFVGDGTTLKLSFKDFAHIFRNTLFLRNRQVPDHPLPSQKVDLSWFCSDEKKPLNSTWLGHSSLMIHIDGFRILTDPVFERTVTAQRLPRFHRQFPLEQQDLENISNVDAVVISHDHKDHLSKPSIQILAPITRKFLVPLGVGTHLLKWGIEANQIVEFDWWEHHQFDRDLTFTATPARHFSGRSYLTPNKTLWCSWVISTSRHTLFFSGDSGYFDGFKQIGDRFGPFDMTFIESGAYDQCWQEIQMNPEEALQAHLDLGGKILHPIHWGTFNQAFHAWDDPMQRLSHAAAEQNVTIATPVAGETIVPDEGRLGSDWWNQKTTSEL